MIRVITILFFSFFVGQNSLANIVTIDDLRDHCRVFVNHFNDDGRRSITFSYQDFQGFKRTARFYAHILPNDFCVSNIENLSIVVEVNHSAFKSYFQSSIKDRGDGDIEFMNSFSNCASDQFKRYFTNILRDRNVVFTPQTQEAIHGMFHEKLCPAFEKAVLKELAWALKKLAEHP